MELNVGNCWDWAFLDRLIELNNTVGVRNGISVTSVYGSLPRLTRSARSADRLPDFPTGKNEGRGGIEEYVCHAQRNGINIRYTLNQSCIGSTQEFEEEWPHLKGNIKYLLELGVREFTITSPLLMELVREMAPDVCLEISTICEIDSVPKLSRWVNTIQADAVCLKLDVNRDFRALREIGLFCRQHDIAVELLANEFCLFGCPWRAECYNLSSHDSRRGPFGFYPFRRCQAARLANPEEWIRSRFILPQWMGLYQNITGISIFKVTGRTHPKEVALPIIGAYMDRDFDGNLLDLWPTISHLGKTQEPKDRDYISTRAVEPFITYFKGKERPCMLDECDECGVCVNLYLKAARKDGQNYL